MNEQKLTPEEIEANMKLEREEKYKKGKRYVETDEYKELVQYFKDK